MGLTVRCQVGAGSRFCLKALHQVGQSPCGQQLHPPPPPRRDLVLSSKLKIFCNETNISPETCSHCVMDITSLGMGA